MQNFTRRDKIFNEIIHAKNNGKYSTRLYLYPSERKKLEKLGYKVSDPKSNSSVACIVSWNQNTDFSNLTPYHYSL